MLDEGLLESINHGQANDLLDPAFAQFRDQTRFWIQRVAVPLIMVVGLFGNLVTVIIMTRRRMRSTTNMYLAALAFVDMLYLVLTFLLGLSHYPNMAGRKYYIYWKLRPFLMMLTDACSNTSVWLTVTFTIERFIAVKYPMKGKVWFTEARAKRLIVGVFLFALLFTLPVPFEWKVIEKPVSKSVKLAIDHDRRSGDDIKISNMPTISIASPDSQSNSTTPMSASDDQIEDSHIMSLEYSDFGRNETYKTMYYWSTAFIFYFIPLLSLTFFNGFLIRSVHRSLRERNKMTGKRPEIYRPEHKTSTDKLSHGSEYGHKMKHARSSKYDTSSSNDCIIDSKACACHCEVSTNQSKLTSQNRNMRMHNCAGMGYKTYRNQLSPIIPEDTIYEEQSQQNGTGDQHFEPTIATSPDLNCALYPENKNQNINSSVEVQNSSISFNENTNSNTNRPVKYSSQRQFDNGNTTNGGTIGVISRQVDLEIGERFTSPNNVQTDCDSSDVKGALTMVKHNATSDLCDSETSISETQSVITSVPFSINTTPQTNQIVSNEKGPAGEPITRLDFLGDNEVTCNTIKVPVQVPSAFSEPKLDTVKHSNNTLSNIGGGGGGSGGGSGGILANQQTTSTIAAPASTQERRITIMLIAVVILFLFCQIPTAAMLLYTSVHETQPNTNEHALLLAFGNIFNFLMAVNAAGNFILYSFLSKKYRRTFVILFCSCFRSKDSQTRAGGFRPQTGCVSSSSSGLNDEFKKRWTSVRFARPACKPPRSVTENSQGQRANQKSTKKRRRDTLV